MIRLTAAEARVLGALMEKEVTTPEYYPLSLNALVAACNQKSSREPVMTLTDRDCEAALRSLEALELVRVDHGTRVERYENRARTVFHLRRDETALLCLLLLRGPQTPGELRGRADRLFAFDDIQQVLAALQRMSLARDEVSQQAEPLVRVLQRQPGAREARYSQLLADADESAREEQPGTMQRADDADGGDASRIVELERTVAELAERVAKLEQQAGIASFFAESSGQ